MSLSLSIAYREMRHNKVPLHRARARTQFQTMCDALSELGGVFWSASSTAEMGKKMLKEMDRVVSEVAASENKKPQQDAANNVFNIGDACDSTSALAAENCKFDNILCLHSGKFQNMLNSSADILQAVGEQATATNGAQTPIQTTQDFDPSIFDPLADIDLFGMFDPAFDLDGFDACLEGNLNPSFPIYYQ
jgi:hypothetical protein